MSFFNLLSTAAPNTPAAGKATIYNDVSDGRIKIIDSNGIVYVLSNNTGPRNQLANGGFDFVQRQVPGTLTTYSQVASRQYAADRWFLSNENASVQFQQIDTITAFETGLAHRYYAKLKKITSAGKMLIGQVLSGENAGPLRGRRVRVQVMFKRTVAAAMSVRIGIAYLTAAGTVDVIPGYAAGVPSGTFISAWGAVGTDPTIGANLTALVPVAGSADGGVISGSGLTCALTAAWVRYGCLFDIPTSARNLIFMVWTDGQPAANDELNIGQAMLVDDTTIQDWAPKPQTLEILRCQQFYAKTFPMAIAPAQNAGLAGAVKGILGKAAAVALAAQINWRYPVVMRATPTLTLYNPSVANAQIRQYNGTAADLTASAVANATDNSTDVTGTGAAGGAVGDGFAVHISADAEI